METEGLGGPCPRCGEMNCFIKKGTGTWYTFIACPSCFFAYGENAGSMLEQTGGMVTGADVWIDVIAAHGIESVDELEEWKHVEKEFTVESPFTFKEEEDWVENMCVVSETVIRELIKGTKHD